MDIDNEEYSDERLEELVIKISNRSSNEILESIKNDVADYTNGALQSDDITCLVLKVK